MKELLRNKIDNEAIRRMQDQPSMVRHPFRIVKIYEGEKEREYVSNVWYLCKKKDSLVRLAEIHFYADNIDDAFCEIQAILNLNEPLNFTKHMIFFNKEDEDMIKTLTGEEKEAAILKATKIVYWEAIGEK